MEQPKISQKAFQDYIAEVYLGTPPEVKAEKEDFLKSIPPFTFEAIAMIKLGRNYSINYVFGFVDALWLIAKTQEEKQISDLEKLAKL